MIATNTLLLTKDGREYGNSIVIGFVFGMYIVKTDYGNVFRFDDGDLEKYFYIGSLATKSHKHRV